MITFIGGLIILIAGGWGYGLLCDKMFHPDDRKTPAIAMQDGVDYVPMKQWKNSLIQLLNIAGTGPILGPIQGILFGPIAFITIPIGCVIGGALHDYYSGMISMRNDGSQMPGLIRKYLGKQVQIVFFVFTCLLMLLVGAVFIYTPGDIFLAKFNVSTDPKTLPVWIVYAVIFIYYIIATLFPIDKIIGKVYPIFGALLIISAVGIFFGLLFKGANLDNIWDTGLIPHHPKGFHVIPIFFVTVACGIVSGFHSTQATMIARTVTDERQGRMTFYNMMLVEGFIAMCWSGAAMYIFKADPSALGVPATQVVSRIAESFLGNIGGTIVVIGVVVLAITSGDTALRSERLMIGELLHIDQTKPQNRLMISGCIFTLVAAILVWAKFNAQGFSILWRYFAWANQTLAVFTFAMITIYMRQNKLPFVMALLPGSFYMFIISSFLLNAKIGFNIPWTPAYIIAGVLTAAYMVTLIFVPAGEEQAKLE